MLDLYFFVVTALQYIQYATLSCKLRQRGFNGQQVVNIIKKQQREPERIPADYIYSSGAIRANARMRSPDDEEARHSRDMHGMHNGTHLTHASWT